MATRKVLITGANGVLGTKLARWLIGIPGGAYHVKLLDDFDGFHQGNRVDVANSTCWEGFPEHITGTFEHVQGTLLDYSTNQAQPPDWVESLSDVDAIVHFMAVNPYPECNGQEAQKSMQMHANLIAAAQQQNVRRLVFASSNHVMGGYWREGPTIEGTLIILC